MSQMTQRECLNPLEEIVVRTIPWSVSLNADTLIWCKDARQVNLTPFNASYPLQHLPRDCSVSSSWA